MNSDAVDIHPAGFEHAGPIFELIKRFPDRLLARPIGDIVQNIDRFLVAVDGGRVVGVISWAILPEIGVPHDPDVELKSLAVEAAAQRRGVGQRLVCRAIERMRGLHPVRAIVLTFTPAFFGKLGFREIPKRALIHKIYAGCINCTRYDSPFTCPEVAMALDMRPPSDAAAVTPLPGDPA